MLKIDLPGALALHLLVLLQKLYMYVNGFERLFTPLGDNICFISFLTPEKITEDFYILYFSAWVHAKRQHLPLAINLRKSSVNRFLPPITLGMFYTYSIQIKSESWKCDSFISKRFLYYIIFYFCVLYYEFQVGNFGLRLFVLHKIYIYFRSYK